MKKHRISAHSQGSSFVIREHSHTYTIPKSVVRKYLVASENTKSEKSKTEDDNFLEDFFEKLDVKLTKPGALLKGLRLRENLSQVEFAKKIGVTQANLSKMENGKRVIGKNIAKRIEQIFGTNYRYFLE